VFVWDLMSCSVWWSYQATVTALSFKSGLGASSNPEFAVLLDMALNSDNLENLEGLAVKNGEETSKDGKKEKQSKKKKKGANADMATDNEDGSSDKKSVKYFMSGSAVVLFDPAGPKPKKVWYEDQQYEAFSFWNDGQQKSDEDVTLICINSYGEINPLRCQSLSSPQGDDMDVDKEEAKKDTQTAVSPFERLLGSNPITEGANDSVDATQIAAINKKLIDSRFSKLFALPSHVVPDVTVLCNSFLSTMIGGIAASRPTQILETKDHSKRRKLNSERSLSEAAAEDPSDQAMWGCQPTGYIQNVEGVFDFESENVNSDQMTSFFEAVLSSKPTKEVSAEVSQEAVADVENEATKTKKGKAARKSLPAGGKAASSTPSKKLEGKKRSRKSAGK